MKIVDKHEDVGVRGEATPVVNCINVKCTNYSYERCFGSFYYVRVTREKPLERRWYEKRAQLSLMKLTPGCVSDITNFGEELGHVS